MIADRRKMGVCLRQDSTDTLGSRRPRTESDPGWMYLCDCSKTAHVDLTLAYPKKAVDIGYQTSDALEIYSRIVGLMSVLHYPPKGTIREYNYSKRFQFVSVLLAKMPM